MYDSLFLSTQGSNILTVLGTLDKIKDKIKQVKYWNVCGNASLILFFKILGYTFEQSFNTISELKIISNTINASSLMPEDEEERKQYIQEWLEEKLTKSKIFNSNTTLKEIYKQTDIFPAFILWSRNKEKIFNINAEQHGDIKIVDAILASLTALGFFTSHKIKNTLFTNVFSIDCYPYLYVYLQEKSKYFYVSVFNNINYLKIEENLGPMQDRENEIITQFCDHNNFRLTNIIKTISEEDIIKVYCSLQRGELTNESAISSYKSGQKQARAFLEGRDTKLEAQKYIENINAQT